MWYDLSCVYVFFFNDTATTEIYTLSLHDALPILPRSPNCWLARMFPPDFTRNPVTACTSPGPSWQDRVRTYCWPGSRRGDIGAPGADRKRAGGDSAGYNAVSREPGSAQGLAASQDRKSVV